FRDLTGKSSELCRAAAARFSLFRCVSAEATPFISHPIEIPPVFGFPRARKNSEISAEKQQNYQRPLAPFVSPTPAPMTRQPIFGIWEHNRNTSGRRAKFLPLGKALLSGPARCEHSAAQSPRRSFPVRGANPSRRAPSFPIGTLASQQAADARRRRRNSD